MVNKPEGCWEIDTQLGVTPGTKDVGNIGTKEEIMAKVKAAKIPEHWKNAIIADIEQFKASAVEIHAHWFLVDGNWSCAYTLKKVF